MSNRKATKKGYNIGNKTYLFTPRLNTGQEQPSTLVPTLPRDQRYANTQSILEQRDSILSSGIDAQGQKFRIRPVFNTYDGTTPNNHSQTMTTNRVGFLIQNEYFIPYFSKTKLSLTYYPLTSVESFYTTPVTFDVPASFFETQEDIAEGPGKPRVAFSLPGPSRSRRSLFIGERADIINDETEELAFQLQILNNLTSDSGNNTTAFRDPLDMSFQAQSIDYIVQYSGIDNPDTPLFTPDTDYANTINYYINVYTSGSVGSSDTVAPTCPECRRKRFVPTDQGLCGPSGTESCTDIGHTFENGPFYDTFRQAAEAIGFRFIGNEGDDETDSSNYDSTDVGLYVAGAVVDEVIHFKRVPYSPAGKKLDFVECAEAAAQIKQFEISWGTDAALVEEIYATGQALVLASGRAKYPNATSHILCPTYWKFVT